MDFYEIKERQTKNGIEVYPDFKVIRSKDLMVRGKSFYAVWDEERGLWSDDEYDVQRLVDEDLFRYLEKMPSKANVKLRLMKDFSSKTWIEFKNYVAHVADSLKVLDMKLTFADTKVSRKDYVSKRLPYSLKESATKAYEELMTTLYNPEELEKIEWAIGAVISGDAKEIQKFIVLYGAAGTGKSTVLNIIQKLFPGYYTTFEAKALTSNNNSFATEMFRGNPLVAIQHDGDLSKIEDNTKLNSIISHEEMTMNEKYKSGYTAKANCFLFLATNQPVKISDAKSGIIRRLIDVRPSGNRIPTRRYQTLVSQIDFELGGIAHHCLEVYNRLGKNHYSDYKPLDMMLQTDVFFNFVEDSFQTFSEQNGATLSQAYEMYKKFCDESLASYKLPRHKFREELKNYFETFHDVYRLDGRQVRSYFNGFLQDKFKITVAKKEEESSWLVLDKETSILDSLLEEMPAQYANESGLPSTKWSFVKTKLKDLDTRKLHYVKIPENHIVIDFDMKNEKGEKDPIRNALEASKFPPTYAEYSKSGGGIHLHYEYSGDTSLLSPIYSEGIEVKVFPGNASLRRKISFCNAVPISTITTGLPLRREKVLDFGVVNTENGIRKLIAKNLRKEIHPATKPSIDFIKDILDKAYASGITYDVTDIRQAVSNFAMGSTNNAELCTKLVSQMHFKSKEDRENSDYGSDELVFFDVEVFPNLLLVNWKYRGKDKNIVRLINPSGKDLEPLFKMKLIGFNCRRYDNHILYARYIGYSLEQIYALSKAIISENRNVFFGEAYNLSYADVYDFSSIKQSLKKFQIDLGIHHKELGIPWDKPVPEEDWWRVSEYCDNDVLSLEAVFDSRKEDFVARQILSDLSGLPVNDTTQQHTAKIIFGNDRNPQEHFVYTDLSTLFPGYTFEGGKSFYRGEDPGEGGHVFSIPGVYENVALLDVVSMYPTNIELLNLFGKYTKNYSQLKEARVLIKHGDYEAASKIMDGAFAKYLKNKEEGSALAYALKIVINIVYGLTSAKFPNKFRDPRNVDNIVAKRGSLFMIELKHACRDKGMMLFHIKTDSVKIANATQEDIDFVVEFGKKYGYTFELEGRYSKLCLINDAVYIARYSEGKNAGKWTATGTEFAIPYVFKRLFSGEEILFEDKCEAKSVTTHMVLDMNENLPEGEHNYVFVGRVGLFCPIKKGRNGGLLLREKDGKYYAVTGTKGQRWLEAETVRSLRKEDDIDLAYYETLVKSSREDIERYVDFDLFVSDKPFPLPF